MTNPPTYRQNVTTALARVEHAKNATSDAAALVEAVLALVHATLAVAEATNFESHCQNCCQR